MKATEHWAEGVSWAIGYTTAGLTSLMSSILLRPGDAIDVLFLIIFGSYCLAAGLLGTIIESIKISRMEK